MHTLMRDAMSYRKPQVGLYTGRSRKHFKRQCVLILEPIIAQTHSSFQSTGCVFPDTPSGEEGSCCRLQDACIHMGVAITVVVMVLSRVKLPPAVVPSELIPFIAFDGTGNTPGSARARCGCLIQYILCRAGLVTKALHSDPARETGHAQSA